MQGPLNPDCNIYPYLLAYYFFSPYPNTSLLFPFPSLFSCKKQLNKRLYPSVRSLVQLLVRPSVCWCVKKAQKNWQGKGTADHIFSLDNWLMMIRESLLLFLQCCCCCFSISLPPRSSSCFLDAPNCPVRRRRFLRSSTGD